MTFKGETIIGKPSLSLIEIYIAEKGLFCEAKDCYDYWENKNWLTAKHVEPKTLETAIDSYNSIIVHRFVKRNAKKLGFTRLNKKEKKRAKSKLKAEILHNGEKCLDNLLKLESFELKRKDRVIKKEYISYDEQLKDKRWEAFRRFIFAVRGRKCEKCGSTKTLQVHHPKYKYGRMAWEYTCKEVIVLCRDCHEKVHNLK